ncbi:NUDIX domain-containing protein [Calidifontibacter sp. DB0510]|uniref:NUDIX domain-containing protein n=1 Tax=Metallococcus carri TaxID=1656884 RepID=A0A967B0X9_9MICO|nr:NUDIX domain-containing protein [Metallococcus carri]NHN55385.1 NUDIX domain-containing protein [Metallococcus carri]NOP36462.1 NUDIX domain-containing protein [Calidifontibacter sp. DB2511S]
MEHPVIVVSAVLLRDARGHVLTVRKRGTDRFMLPGGKPEPGETPAQTAVRECQEELGLDLDPARLVDLGVWRTWAANERDHRLEASVFEHPSVPVEQVAAELEELRWLDPAGDLPDDLAPLTVEVVREHVR